ncbi:tetratricopeptide repeat protein [Rummeliibacillus pycnus]|uniref:tetratricopeptide repeat protein n=1 Tax=Rummeliibacillus pycnus TaxID=101070 RepID=UPI003D2DE82A
MNKLSTESLTEQIANQVIQHKETIPSKKSYLQLSNLFEQLEQPKKAVNVLHEGLQVYPTSIQLHQALWTLYTKRKAKKEKILHLPRTLKRRFVKRPIIFFDQLQNTLLKNNQLETFLSISKMQLQQNPQQIELQNKVIQHLLSIGQFEEAIPYLETLKTLEKNPKQLVKINMQIGMVNMLFGHFDEAEKYFSYCQKEFADILPEIYPNSYEKLVIFNNGESSIEFYKYIYPTKHVVATFDAIDKTDSGKPFAFKVLKKKAVDLISLRRGHMQNYHQDISREEYFQAIEKLVPFYEKRFAYGTSLGGYNALFLGSMIPDCQILSFAPRNPAHPIYGTKERKYTKFVHPVSHPINKEIQPIICFDPKDTIDNPYTTKEIMQSYPNGIYKHFDYAGHRVPTYLRETGELKEIVSSFLEEKPFPDYDHKLRSKSAEYHRVLGIHCRRHNKLRWALELANKSIEIAPKYDRSLALRIEILLKLKQFDECITYANEAIQLHPKSARFYILLADAYKGKGNTNKAVEVLESASKKVQSIKLKEKLATLK